MLLDLATVIGFVGGWILLIMGMGGPAEVMTTFFNVPSFIVTVGGTCAAMMLAFNMKQLQALPKICKHLLYDLPMTPQVLIRNIVSFAEKARREGLLALEDDIEKLDDTFLQKGIQLVVDGTEAEIIRSILDVELEYLEERHKGGRNIFDQGALIAPAFGMIGTLMGLILMLKSLDDPDTLGPGMALALITTFYGAVIANFICVPMGNKLNVRNGGEVMMKTIMIEGILSIQAGFNPRIVEERLNAFLPPAQRKGAEEEDEDEDEDEE